MGPGFRKDDAGETETQDNGREHHPFVGTCVPSAIVVTPLRSTIIP